MNFYSKTFELNAILHNRIDEMAKIMAGNIKNWISNLNIGLTLEKENSFYYNNNINIPQYYRHQLFYKYPGIQHYIRIGFHGYSNDQNILYYSIESYSNTDENESISYNYAIYRNNISNYSISIFAGTKSIILSFQSIISDNNQRLCFFNTYDKDDNNLIFINKYHATSGASSLFYDKDIDKDIVGAYDRDIFTDISLTFTKNCFLLPYFLIDGNSTKINMIYKVEELFWAFGAIFTPGSEYLIDDQKYYCIRSRNLGSIMVKKDN